MTPTHCDIRMHAYCDVILLLSQYTVYESDSHMEYFTCCDEYYYSYYQYSYKEIVFSISDKNKQF